jgi:hypothetical protein
LSWNWLNNINDLRIYCQQYTVNLPVMSYNTTSKHYKEGTNDKWHEFWWPSEYFQCGPCWDRPYNSAHHSPHNSGGTLMWKNLKKHCKEGSSTCNVNWDHRPTAPHAVHTRTGHHWPFDSGHGLHTVQAEKDNGCVYKYSVQSQHLSLQPRQQTVSVTSDTLVNNLLILSPFVSLLIMQLITSGHGYTVAQKVPYIHNYNRYHDIQNINSCIEKKVSFLFAKITITNCKTHHGKYHETQM